MIVSKNKQVGVCGELVVENRRSNDFSFGCVCFWKTTGFCVLWCGSMNDEQLDEQQATTNRHTIITTCGDNDDGLLSTALLVVEEFRHLLPNLCRCHPAGRLVRVVDDKVATMLKVGLC